MDDNTLLSTYRKFKKIFTRDGGVDLMLSNDELKNVIFSYYVDKENLIDEEFEDLGYYEIRSREIYESDRDNADFRFLRTAQFKEPLYLIRHDSYNWDTSMCNHELNIKEKENKILKKVNN